MRIAIDVSSLKVTGAGTTTYISELIQSIRNLQTPHQLIEVSYEPKFDRRSSFFRKYDTLNREIFWVKNTLPGLVKKFEADLLHIPAMAGPTNCSFPVISTIHDIYVLKNPQSFKWWLRNYLRFMLPRVIRKSTRLLAVSKFTKNEILNMFREIDEKKIIVTYEGVDGFFNKIPHDELSDLKNRYKIVKPYLLTVSTIEPRKNISNVLKAFAQIKNKIDHDLLLVGAWGWYSNDLINLIEALKIKKRIKFLGFLNREELRLMYNSAEVFLYPSLYEGFGLPLLEAMACGCPVLTSNISALPEVAGDAAITVNPHCVEEISDGILTLVNDKEKREALSKKGLTRAKMFSWEKCAQETIKAYSEMLCSF